jgi:FAD/FMN-containing dehydrogenase
MVDAVASVTPAQIAEFREGFAGEVVLPGDPGYDDARRVWSALFDRHPAMVARPTSVFDVIAAVRFARERDLDLTVRGGGHSAAGHSTCDGGLVVDLSAMRGVTVDAERRTARANGGALLSELDAAGQAHGLVCPVGVIGHTGVGGLTLGGGMGRLQRKFGLTIDNLRAVELVTADGEAVRASESEHPDLFWAIRGAGANFGVVTAFEFGLQPFDGTLIRAIRMYDAKHAHEVWENARAFAESAPDEVSFTFGMGRAEPPGDYPEALAGRPMVFVALNHCGRPEDVDRDIAPLLAGPEPAVATRGPVNYLELQVANDEAMASGSRAYITGGFTNGLAPGTLDALVDHVADAPGEAGIGLAAFGGAVGRVAADATAFPSRSAAFEMSADSGAWTDPELDDRYIRWSVDAMAILNRDAVPGRYVNEITETGPDVTRSIYGDATYERLAGLKRAWDPDNVFRANHNIAPAG